MKRSERSLLSWLLLAASIGAAGVVAGPGCSGDDTHETNPPPPKGEKSGTTVSSSIVLTKDDSALWVVNQDSDSVSVLDPETRKLVAEIPLGPAPAVDPATKRFDPAVSPRALAIVGSAKVYVAGQAANQVFVVDAKKHEVIRSIAVAASPSAVAAAPDGSAVYVVSHEAGVVSKIDTATDAVTATVPVSEHPWSITVSGDGNLLFVTHLLLGPGVTVLDANALTIKNKVALADQTPGADKRLPNGVARGLYAAVPRPTTGELWIPHLLLAVATAQPDLDFESTVFPTISTVTADGSAEGKRLLFQPLGVPGAAGSFTDSVSGPHAVAFTPDGKLALVVLSQSEDILVFNAETGNEESLVRPLPSAFLEGIAIDSKGERAFVDGRNTHDVTVLSIDASDTILPVKVDGEAIDRIEKDPMPADLRLGQRLFYTANSAAFPITKNFWVACASCHIEGGSDAVTWIFNQGPRDTPSNAGGPINTGFLFRQAVRNKVEQYDETIRVEQGGNYHLDEPAQQGDLAALAAFVNYAIPFPENPYLAADGELTTSQASGKVTFDMLCASCHSGPYLSDSGSGNPGLDLAGEVLLHDIDTCVIGGKTPDKVATDVLGNPRTACDFDTPTLRGIFATAPYFHDGSALTLKDVVDRLPFSAGLEEGEKEDLVAYLQTL